MRLLRYARNDEGMWDRNDNSRLSVGRGQRLGFLQLHFLAAADDRAFPGLCTQRLAAARFTLESFTKLVRHIISPLKG